MTREQCEKLILAHLRCAWEVAKIYCPEDDYLTLCVTGGNAFHFNNSYFDHEGDEDFPVINYTGEQ